MNQSNLYTHMENDNVNQNSNNKLSLSNPYIKVGTEKGEHSLYIETIENNHLYIPACYYDKSIHLERMSKYVKKGSIFNFFIKIFRNIISN